MRKIAHWFAPHPTTHEKAKLLSWHFLFIYFLLFALLRVGFDLVNIYKPGVLGVTSQISVQQIIDETNRKRQEKGLPPLVENTALSKAAQMKAVNMFEENYWAHFSPSGRDPWGFIRSAGYKFAYAGENLARNFYNSDEVVKAWMNSPSHRDNLLNPNYRDIGIAVSEGVLQGQNTTLVVQMFGKSYEAVAAVPSSPQADLKGVEVRVEYPRPHKSTAISAFIPSQKPVLDPFAVTKNAGIMLILLIGSLLIVDLIVLKRRGVFRISSHHVAHLGFLAVVSMSVLLSRTGEIL